MFFLSSINHLIPYTIILVSWLTVGYYYMFPSNTPTTATEGKATQKCIHITTHNSSSHSAILVFYLPRNKHKLTHQTSDYTHTADACTHVLSYWLKCICSKYHFPEKTAQIANIPLRRGPPVS